MNRIRISILAMLLLSCVAHGQDLAALAQQALTLQQSGRYAEAADAYRDLLKLDPSQVATHVNLAIVLVNLGQFDKAIAEYQAANLLLPGDPRIGLNLGLAYQKSGQIEEALKHFEALHTRYPQEEQITLLLADCSLQLGDTGRVIALLQPLALQDSGNLGLAYMLGMALLREHRTEEGQVFLDRILKNGDTAEARFLLGTRMFAAGDYPAAVKQFASAVELNPKLPQLQSLYGQSLLNTGDADGAAKAFAHELASNSNDFDANLHLAEILVERRRFAEAEPIAQRALALRPDSATADLAVAESRIGNAHAAQAKIPAEAAVAGLPHSAEAHLTLAAALAAQHDASGAAKEQKRAESLFQQQNAAAPGPHVHDPAPAFELPRSGTPGTVSLRDYRGKSPLVLIFGSYTCPNFRDSADALRALGQRYGARVPFLLVYIREAHSTTDWQSTRNKSDVELAPAATMDEKQGHAQLCSRKLHLPFPAVVDSMENTAETAYNAWPSRAFIVGADGLILYSTRLTEFDFHPAEMEAILKKVQSR